MSRYYLKGFDNVFQTSINNEIQDNLIEYFDWGLLEKGNYFNVTIGETSSDGLDYSLLKPSANPHFASGQAWEGFRKNWIWQSGISVPSGFSGPLVGADDLYPGISGVYVDDAFYPSNTSGTYSHYVDYFNGRVVFNSPIPSGSKVQAEYSYKYINVLYSSSLPWLREVQYRSLEVNDSFINKSDDFRLPAESRIQLPAIAIEIVPRRTFRGYQLGGGQIVYTDVIFHCLAEDEFTRNQLLDIVSIQNDQNIALFDSNNIVENNKSPLSYQGFPVSGSYRYPDLLYNFPGGSLRLTNSIVQNIDTINSNFYAGTVRSTFELIKSGI